LTAADAAAYCAAHPLPEPTPADRQRAHARSAAACANRSHRTAVAQASRGDQAQAVLANPQASAGAKYAAEQNLEDARTNHRFAVAEVVHYGRRERVHGARAARREEPQIVTPSRTARPRERRPRAQASRSSAKSGDGPGDGGDPPPPRQALRLALPSRAVLVLGDRPAADMEAGR